MNYPHSSPTPQPSLPTKLDASWLRQLCLDCGADGAGLVEIERPALDEQRDDVLRFFPSTRTLLSFVCRMNREPIRSPARSVANLEFHHTLLYGTTTVSRGSNSMFSSGRLPLITSL